MTDFVVTFNAGQLLPNGEPADDMFIIVEAADEVDVHHKLWDLFMNQYGEVFDVHQATDVMKGRREIIAEQWLTVQQCPSCRARVIRVVKVSNLSPALVDADANQTGNVLITRFSKNGPPMARTLGTAAQFGRTNLRTMHACKRRQSKGVHA